MKTSFFVALLVLASATLFFSSDWFNGKTNQDKSAFVLEGKWNLDSIVPGKDSSNGLGILLLALAEKDSSRLFTFTKDSIIIPHLPTVGYTINKDRLLVQEDSVQHQFSWKAASDSSFTITSKDSIVYYLRKIKE